jgi:hypothetical protein
MAGKVFMRNAHIEEKSYIEASQKFKLKYHISASTKSII